MRYNYIYVVVDLNTRKILELNFCTEPPDFSHMLLQRDINVYRDTNPDDTYCQGMGLDDFKHHYRTFKL